MPLWFLAALLGAPAQQQIIDVQSPLEKDPVRDRIQALKQAKDWAGAADLVEALTPAQRARYLMDWELALARAGRWERLEAVCKAVLTQREAKTGPRPSIERTYLPQALFQQGFFQEAMEANALNAGLTGFPSDFAAACGSAERLGDWIALEHQADAYLAKHPTKGEAMAFRGEALTRQKRYPEAEPLLRKALEADPRLAFAWTTLSCCLNEGERYPEAQEAASKALALEPASLEARSNRGRSLVGRKQFLEARADYAAILAVQGGDPALRANAKLNVETIDAYLPGPAKKPKKR